MVKTWKYLKDLRDKDKIFKCKGVYILYDLKSKICYIGCSINIYERLKRHFLKYKSKSMICGILLNGNNELSNKIKFPLNIISDVYFIDKKIKNWHYKLESKYIERYKPKLNNFNIRNIKLKHKELILRLLRSNDKRIYIEELLNYLNFKK